MTKAYSRFTPKEVDSKIEWDKFLDVSRETTFFHSFEWREFLVKVLHCRPFYLGVQDEVGQLCGVFPSVILGSNSFKACLSLPLSDYGGPLTTSVEARYSLYGHLMKSCARLGISFVRLSLLEPFCNQLFSSNLGCVDRGKGVVEIDLAGIDSDFVWNHVFSRGMRRKINRLEKSELAAYELSSKYELRNFYRIYAMNLKHIGAVPQTFSFLETMWELLHPRNMRIWLMGTNGPVGGLLVLKDHKASHTYFLGIDRTKVMNFSVHQYLVWSEILRAEEEGLRKVSLGSAPAELEESHNRAKRELGGVFRQQEISWIPTDFKGFLFLQARGKVANFWRRGRKYLPKETKNLLTIFSKYTFSN
jgi:hypothetical protein